jgi:hypothetical protein
VFGSRLASSDRFAATSNRCLYVGSAPHAKRFSALAGEALPSHLRQAGSAVLAVKQVQERQHDRTSLFDQWRPCCAGTVSGRFRRQPKAVSLGDKMVSSEPGERSTAVETSGRPVDSCAASSCEQGEILAARFVDMLRIFARTASGRCRGLPGDQAARVISLTASAAAGPHEERATRGENGHDSRTCGNDTYLKNGNPPPSALYRYDGLRRSRRLLAAFDGRRAHVARPFEVIIRAAS